MHSNVVHESNNNANIATIVAKESKTKDKQKNQGKESIEQLLKNF